MWKALSSGTVGYPRRRQQEPYVSYIPEATSAGNVGGRYHRGDVSRQHSWPISQRRRQQATFVADITEATSAGNARERYHRGDVSRQRSCPASQRRRQQATFVTCITEAARATPAVAV